jgi:hypothetical protein
MILGLVINVYYVHLNANNALIIKHVHHVFQHNWEYLLTQHVYVNQAIMIKH